MGYGAIGLAACVVSSRHGRKGRCIGHGGDGVDLAQRHPWPWPSGTCLFPTTTREGSLANRTVMSGQS